MVTEHLVECKRDGYLFTCDVCRSNFLSALGLDKHKKKIHPELSEAVTDEPSELSSKGYTCPFHDNDEHHFPK